MGRPGRVETEADVIGMASALLPGHGPHQAGANASGKFDGNKGLLICSKFVLEKGVREP